MELYKFPFREWKGAFQFAFDLVPNQWKNSSSIIITRSEFSSGEITFIPFII